MNDPRHKPHRARLLLWAALAFAVFVACCALIYWGSAWVSQSPVATYILLTVTAVSAFAVPILLGRAAFGAFLGKVHRRVHRP